MLAFRTDAIQVRNANDLLINYRVFSTTCTTSSSNDMPFTIFFTVPADRDGGRMDEAEKYEQK